MGYLYFCQFRIVEFEDASILVGPDLNSSSQISSRNLFTENAFVIRMNSNASKLLNFREWRLKISETSGSE